MRGRSVQRHRPVSVAGSTLGPVLALESEVSPARAGHSPSPPSLCLAVWNVSIARLPNALSSARAVHPPPGAGGRPQLGR